MNYFASDTKIRTFRAIALLFLLTLPATRAVDALHAVNAPVQEAHALSSETAVDAKSGKKKALNRKKRFDRRKARLQDLLHKAQREDGRLAKRLQDPKRPRRPRRHLGTGQGLLIAGGITCLLGLILMLSSTRETDDLDDAATGCVNFFVGLALVSIGGVLLIIGGILLVV